MLKRLKYIIAATLCLALLLCGCVETPVIPYNVYDGTIQTQDGVSIDTGAMTITFGADAVLEYNGSQLSLGGIVYDCSRLQDGDRLYYHINEKKISPYDTHESVFMGTYRQPAFLSELNVDLTKLYVDGRSAASIVTLGKATIACLGDSMTCGAGSTPGYAQFLPRLLGTNSVLNYGLRESTISQDPQSASLDSITFRSKLMNKDADIIIVLGCLNDWLEGWELDESTDPTANALTFRHNFRELCKNLKETYPDAYIYIFSSPETNPETKPAQDLTGTEWEGNTEGYNRIGKKLSDYSAAMEEICKEENIPFCPLTETLSWEVFDGEAQYSSAEKALLIAEHISEFILDSFS